MFGGELEKMRFVPPVTNVLMLVATIAFSSFALNFRLFVRGTLTMRYCPCALTKAARITRLLTPVRLTVGTALICKKLFCTMAGVPF